MSEQKRQFDQTGDPDATVVSPFFDDDATVVAQPVVPLDDRAVTEGVGTYVGTGTAPPAYERAWKHRTHMMVALVLAALALGTVAGAVGVRIYQNRARADRPAESEQTQTATAPAEQAAPTAVSETAPQSPQAAVNVPVAVAETSEPETRAAVTAESRPAVESKTAGEPSAARKPSRDAEQVVPVRQGKKAEREAERADPPRPRLHDTMVLPSRSPEAERRAQREEDRLRRAERAARRDGRRERRARMVDSVRGIFEGNNSPPR
jgi:hypothetical protein